MRRNVDKEILEMVRLTKENPGKHTIYSLALELDISISTATNYVKELELPVKKCRTNWTDEQLQFVKDNAATITNPRACKVLGLKPYQVQDIATKVGVKFFVKKKEKVESEFFEHDKSGIW